MKIYDITTFNGESEIFELRYQILKDFVDEFRVIEFDKTFSGKDKFMRPLHLVWPLKVKHYLITEDIWSKYEDLAKSSPNTEYGKGAEHWVREFCQKESIKDCLTDLKDDDMVIIGDCDEIPEIDKPTDSIVLYPSKIKLRVYSYYLNNNSNEEFWGNLIGTWQDIKGKCLNELRAFAPRIDGYRGWHFTSIGGYENVKKKLTDSYTSDSYANDQVLDNLQDNISNNKDFLGRDFTYKLDEENWPQYLKDNKDKYKHLCLQTTV